MTEQKDGREFQEFLYLTVCGVRGEAPKEEILLGMNWQKVYEISRFHNLAALCCMAVESALQAGGEAVFRSGRALSAQQREVLAAWREKKNKAARKNMLLDAERGRLEAFLEEQGIWYLPLKGVWFQTLYPRAGMRQMADNDILFDAAGRKQVREWFLSQGYEVESYGKGAHDVYRKPPVMNFEMHTALFTMSGWKEVWNGYYRDVKERLIREEGRAYRYRFSAEDFYVYFIVHAYKHHDGSGTGLRTLTDEFVYLERYEREMDWGYIGEQLESLRVAEFEGRLRSLTEKVFKTPGLVLGWLDGAEQARTERTDRGRTDRVDREKMDDRAEQERTDWGRGLSQEEEEFLEDVLRAGTYGTVGEKVRKQLREIQKDREKVSFRTKLRYCWRRLVPGEEYFRVYFPFFHRHKWLIPAFLVFRLFRGLILGHKRLGKELSALRKPD